MYQYQQNCLNLGAPILAATTSTVPPAPLPAQKKKRLQAIPDDADVEVIALSAEELTAKSQFICEWCNKEFNRDQNLQLHKKAHNIPFKLNNRPPKNKDETKKVYVCPDTNCANHERRNALGDLTSMKKHFKRKHSVKTMSCTKCFKKYGVKADLRAHLKICGTKEYKCTCGFVFTRKDSFKNHFMIYHAPAAAQQSFALDVSTTTGTYSFPFLSTTLPAPPSSNSPSSAQVNESVHSNMTTDHPANNNTTTEGSKFSDVNYDINVLYDSLFSTSSAPPATELPHQDILGTSGTSAFWFTSNLKNSTTAGLIGFESNNSHIYPDLSNATTGMENKSCTYEDPDLLGYYENNISGDVFDFQVEDMQELGPPELIVDAQINDDGTGTINGNIFSTSKDKTMQKGPSEFGGGQVTNQQEQLPGIGGDANFPLLQDDFLWCEKYWGN